VQRGKGRRGGVVGPHGEPLPTVASAAVFGLIGVLAPVCGAGFLAASGALRLRRAPMGKRNKSEVRTLALGILLTRLRRLHGGSQGLLPGPT
jgi:hypothetical protein